MNMFDKSKLTGEYLKKAGTTLLVVATLELIGSIILLFAPMFGTTVVTVLVGIAFIISGVSKIMYTLKHQVSTGKTVLGIILGALFILVGVISIPDPVYTASYLTLAFGFILMFEGFTLLFTASDSPSKGLSIFNGIITLLLAFLILINFPASILIFPFYIAISLLFNSITLYATYGALKKQKKENPEQFNNEFAEMAEEFKESVEEFVELEDEAEITGTEDDIDKEDE